MHGGPKKDRWRSQAPVLMSRGWVQEQGVGQHLGDYARCVFEHTGSAAGP